ncbi:MAG: GNAT family N-acetyltransferase [Anaerolineae bacterium]
MTEQISVEVRRPTDLSPLEQEAVDALGGGDSSEDPRFTGFEWAPAQWQVVGCLGDRIVSGVKITVRDVTVAGRQVRVAGIGDVATLPEYRRRGFAGAALARAGEFLCRELGVEFGLLFCDTHLLHYYGKFGWQRVDGPTMVQLSWGEVPFPEETMVLPCGDRQWPGGPTNLNGLPW